MVGLARQAVVAVACLLTAGCLQAPTVSPGAQASVPGSDPTSQGAAPGEASRVDTGSSPSSATQTAAADTGTSDAQTSAPAPVLVTNVTVQARMDSAVVAWDVARADGGVVTYVEWGPGPEHGSATEHQAGVGHHDATLGGLAGGQEVHYCIVAVPIGVAATCGADAAFTTPTAPQDATDQPPSISQVGVASVSAHAATVTYDVADDHGVASSGVEYGPDLSYGSFLAGDTGAGTRSVQLTGLLAATTYHARVHAVDSAAATADSPDLSFTTAADAPPADTTPPAIASVQVAPGSDRATVSWDVSDAGGGVVSRADYGATTSYGASLDALAGTGSRSVTVTGLSPGATYHVRVHAVDGAGNPADSADQSFTTTASAPPLSISGIQVSALMDDGFQVSWTIAGSTAASSHLEFGASSAYGSQGPALAGTGGQVTTIMGQPAHGTVHFRVVATDGGQAQQSSDAQQVTARLYQVTIQGNSGSSSFSPDSLAVVAGDPFVVEVTAAPGSGGGHNWDLAGQGYASGFPAPGSSVKMASSKVLAAGTYPVHCDVHASMTGSVVAS